MCLVSLVLDTRLSTLIFQFLTTSETHIFPYESLILLQVLLHLLVFNTKTTKYGSSLLTLTISGLTLHFSLVIEVHISGVTVNKFTLDKIVNSAKNSFNKLKRFYIIYSFSLNTYEYLKYHQLQ